MTSQAKITLEFPSQTLKLLEINQYTAVLYMALAIFLLYVTVLYKFRFASKIMVISPFICSAIILRFIDLVFLLIEHSNIFLESDILTKCSFLAILILYLLLLNFFVYTSAKLKIPFKWYILLFFFFIVDFIIFEVFSDQYFSMSVTLNSNIPKTIQFLYKDKIFYLLFAISILLIGLELLRLLTLAYNSLRPVIFTRFLRNLRY